MGSTHSIIDLYHPRYSFMPFGAGPRNCIAMRFALFELKIGLVSVLRKYRLVKTPNTPEKIELKVGTMTGTKRPLLVAIERR